MYFPVLNVLKASEGFNDDIIEEFDALLYQIYREYADRFHPRIYKRLEVTVDEKAWLSALNQLSNCGFLKANFELCCPETDETIEVFNRFDDIPFGKNVGCPYCGNEFTVDETDIFITYTFENKFKPQHRSERDQPFFRHWSVSDEEQLSLDYYKINPSIVYDMIFKDRRRPLGKMMKELSVTNDNNKKGKLYELLAEYIFSSFYLVPLDIGRAGRYSTGQIDVIFNVKRLEATIFHEFSDLMFVECKNWGNPVGVPEIGAFSTKLADNRVKVGIIFARSGVTGDIKADFPKDGMGEIRRLCDRGQGLILVYTQQDILDILAGKNVYDQLVDRYYFFKIV